jgi:hypothetical protein
MDRDAIDRALHEIQQMVEVSIRAAESLHGSDDDNEFFKCRPMTPACWISASLTSRSGLRRRGQCSK